MTPITAFLSSNMGAAIITYLALGLCTLVFKPRSAAEYAAMASRNPAWLWSRLAAFFQLVAGLGFDPSKVAEAIVKVITGRVAPLTIGLIADGTPGAYRKSAPPRSSSIPVITTDSEPPTMKRMVPSLVRGAGGRGVAGVGCFVACVALFLGGCTPGAQADAKTVVSELLSVSQIACLFASTLTDSKAVMQACSIDATLAPVVQQLIAQREGAKKQGVMWTADAGAP